MDDEGAVRIAAAKLRARLEAACSAAIERGQRVYGDALTLDSPQVRAYSDFVSLAERLEAEGRKPRVLASY